MKYLLIILGVISLQGCVWQTANTADIVKAVKFCGSADKIATLHIGSLGDERVICMNGKSTYLDRLALED